MTRQAAVGVLLVHESTLVRDLLKRALPRAGIVVEADTGDRLRTLELSEKHRAGVLIISSYACSDDLLRDFPAILATGARILCLATGQDERRIGPILLAGGSGWLVEKDAALPDVLAAIEAVAAGHAALHPVAALAVLDQWRANRDGTAQPSIGGPIRRLTVRESEILAAMSSGLTTGAIATKLGLAIKTVETHKGNIFAKLGARNQAHAVALAAERRMFMDSAPGSSQG